MKTEYIISYLQNPYWDNQKEAWQGSLSMYRPTIGEYYTVKIPLPHKLVENKLEEIIAEEPTA